MSERRFQHDLRASCAEYVSRSSPPNIWRRICLDIKADFLSLSLWTIQTPTQQISSKPYTHSNMIPRILQPAIMLFPYLFQPAIASDLNLVMPALAGLMPDVGYPNHLDGIRQRASFWGVSPKSLLPILYMPLIVLPLGLSHLRQQMQVGWRRQSRYLRLLCRLPGKAQQLLVCFLRQD